MGYKIKEALKKSKLVFIVFLILWVVLSIVLTTSIAVSMVDAKASASVEGASDFIEIFISNIGDIGGNVSKAFKPQYLPTFWKVEIRLTIILFIFLIIGILRSMPKHEYSGIENGSSDWASGEQYSILSKNKGILLAENHYLPIDKRGNTNVLVVGRFWFSENLHHTLFLTHINY